MESVYLWIVALGVIAITLKYGPRFFASASTVASTSENNDAADKKPLMDNDDGAVSTSSDQDSISESKKEKEFAQFQKWYIVIFLLAMSADWMQGPYVYKLYSSYGIGTSQIAVLFCIGFATSGMTGAFIGSLADKFGRKRMCLLFCVFYAICCATKHFHDFPILVLGRVLGGISTSILFSCFESWMVTHHHHRQYAGSKLGETFERAWSLNSFIAILAGIITSYAVSYYEKHDIIAGGPYEIAAFDCSAVTLMVALVMIASKWRQENYGDASVNMQQSLRNSLQLFRTDTRILLVGVVQSGFESAMYLFVFMWTMALEKTAASTIDHGMVFAVFMEACLVGTTLSGILQKSYHMSAEKLASCLAAAACVALLCVPFTENYEIRLFLFILFEGCVGVYFPVIGGLRGKYVPDNLRATIMNVFRIPLNIIVVSVLWYIDELGLQNVFMLAATLLAVACVASYALNKGRLMPEQKEHTTHEQKESTD